MSKNFYKYRPLDKKIKVTKQLTKPIDQLYCKKKSADGFCYYRWSREVEDEIIARIDFSRQIAEKDL